MQLFARSMVIVVAAVARLPHSTEANAFLNKRPGVEMQPRIEILDVLEEELGSGHGRTDEARVKELQEELKHTFAALPKTRPGNLHAAGARYALHRLFVQRHAWQLKGLNPAGEGWSNTSFADVLEGSVPTKTQMIFLERFGAEGVSLHELAVLAALLESMVHVEVDDRLRITLQALEENETSSLSEEKATAVFHAYMASYLHGALLANLTPYLVRRHVENVAQVYPTWPDTQEFVIGVRDSVANGATMYNFSLMSDVLSRVGDKYGRWQSTECSALKSAVVKMESRPGSGRVRLSDFYGSALTRENWQFSESSDYLRQVGALDESNPSEPSVVIPNYIVSPSNCVASSGYYNVCCLDECEDLMDHLELQIGAPTGSVDSIAHALSGLPSHVPVANRTFSDALLKRLTDVAAYHQGAVPLHGRLFAQWMHHAYPRECPFPHVSGTTDPVRMREYTARTGSQATASKEEMQQFASAAAARGQVAEDIDEGLCSNMWTMEEELVDASAHEAHQKVGQTRKTLVGTRTSQIAVLCVATVSVTLALAKTAMSVLKGSREEELAKKGTPASTLFAKGVTYSV